MSCLLLVHAHPDDECITTGGIILRAKLDAHRVVLITATRGEEGEAHNGDAAALRPRMAEIRCDELRECCAILGVDRQEFLDYRDSGVAGSASNDDPRSFHRASLGEAAERVARFLREERPDIVVTYTADGTYGHPDHLKAHDATFAALDVLAKEGWQPRKVYLHALPQSVVQTVLEVARVTGIQMPPRLTIFGTLSASTTLIHGVHFIAPKYSADALISSGVMAFAIAIMAFVLAFRGSALLRSPSRKSFICWMK